MTMAQSGTFLRGNLEKILPADAVEWLMMLFKTIQVFDDYADGDPVTKEELYETIWNAIVAMPSNQFYKANAGVLSPLLALAVLKWRAANVAELIGKADERSYMWRAEYYGIVLMCVNICHGPERTAQVADEVLGLYGESYKDYIKEFEECQSLSQP